MKYLRLFADENGESHVEEMSIDFDMQAYAPPAPAFGVSAPTEAERFVTVHFPAFWSSEFHSTPRRQLLIMLSGHLEGHASDGTIIGLEAGDVLLMEDTTGMGHSAKAMDGKEVYAMMIHLE